MSDMESTPVVENGEVDLKNGNNNVPSESPNITPTKEGRVIHKAKRTLRQSPNVVEGAVNGDISSLVPKQLQKNSRKSRTGFGRGLPKKGGAGGKGTWGTPGSEMEEVNVYDEGDPNYDSDSNGDYVVKKVVPEVTEDELTKSVEPILQEYLEHGDTDEVAASLKEMNIGSKKHKITELAVSLAMDRKASHRELISVLISDLYSKVLSQGEMAQGFDKLLHQLPELVIDCPDACDILGQFIARAVADDCLPPKFVHSFKGKVDNKHILKALEKTDVLLNMKHGIVRLDNVWGVGGGIRPVKYLINRMVLLLKEYLSSGDISEATQCLKDLEVPHFHHELVYEATVIVIEESSERSAKMMSSLLASLYKSVIITKDQMETGMMRIYENMPEISIDVPAAYMLLERFANFLQRDGAFTDKLTKELPNRGRKRFVSEGDGGKVKETELNH
ncbi:unnamed protein product [Owenia fusiformis]|uniref:Programmed cell death protein 4 n=1 Tax=Owenia fusiformis TaxID=6347 RepID=A0A8J1T6C6_OWEFU|nr:unnamed protein product [Owenia fusiformis]CAH1784454.1 unnamed protein product [Owenia fusiformis]